MIEQNSNLKQKFDSYDLSKEKYFVDMINNMEEAHKKDIEGYFVFYFKLFRKYSNQDQLFSYIKSLEVNINKYKIKESQYSESIQELTNNLDKQEKINEQLRAQIEKLNRKLANSNMNSKDK